MVTIYALINPFNNIPFYIGSTSLKLRTRLSNHLNGYEGTKEKKQLIKDIKIAGLKVEIKPIMVCSERAASKCESYVHYILCKSNITLYQDQYKIGRKKGINKPYRQYVSTAYPFLNKPKTSPSFLKTLLLR